MVVDIGGGTTDAAIITMAGIVKGCSVKIAGDEMDEAVARYVRHKYNMLIGPRTAEIIKKTIGSANPMHSEGAVDVRGRDLARGIPCIQRISSEEIRDALAEPVFAIIETVRQTLEEAPPEVASDIMDHGIVLTGGGALLKNLDSRIKEETGLPVVRVDDPLTSVALGAGKVMADPKLLKKIALN
jgi:rod shape-determining protein MreB